jgi:hypothetical protein
LKADSTATEGNGKTVICVEHCQHVAESALGDGCWRQDGECIVDFCRHQLLPQRSEGGEVCRGGIVEGRIDIRPKCNLTAHDAGHCPPRQMVEHAGLRIHEQRNESGSQPTMPPFAGAIGSVIVPVPSESTRTSSPCHRRSASSIAAIVGLLIAVPPSTQR